MLAGVVIATAVSACGSQPRQDASEPSGTFAVQVVHAAFPARQQLSQHTKLVISVRNTGSKTIPDIAVTLLDPKLGTTVAPFGQRISQPTAASQSRPVWIVDRPPGTCGFSCQTGGAGGAVTADTNTWALGRLAPGRTATFSWNVTAVSPGMHSIEYEVAAGLNGKAKARLADGQLPKGVLTVRISNKPSQAYVNNSGQIVTTP